MDKPASREPRPLPADGNPAGPGGLLDWTVRLLLVATDVITLEDTQEISRRVVDALWQALGFPMVSILLADEAGNLVYAADHGIGDEVKAMGFRREGTTYTAFRTSHASFVEDAKVDARANPGTRDLMGAYAALPIHHRERSYGVIMVTFREPHVFPPIERVVLETFARQMAIALDNGRLHRQELRRIAFLAAQADLAQALSATLAGADVARILGGAIRDMEGVGGVAVWTSRSEGLAPSFADGFTDGALLPDAWERALAAAGSEALIQMAPGDLLAEGCLPEDAALRVFVQPLRCAGVLEGLLAVQADPRRAEPDLMRALGERAAVALHNAHLYEDSQAAASIDPLTGLFNRRAFTASARVLVASALRANMPLTLIMLDADHFKACNDTHGHGAGDKVLVLLAQVLRAQVRPADLAGRLGGEEFAVILQGAAGDTAFRVAERIRNAMAASRLELENGTSIAVPTVSLGLAELGAGGARDLEHLLEQADAALYRAKGEGRNRTCWAGEGPAWR